MLAIERRNEILGIIQKNQRVIVSELSKQFDVTDETIRRDLEKLQKDGYVKKTYGGAVYIQNFNVDIPFAIRERSNKKAKAAIGKKAAQLIEDGDCVMLDSSSTALAVAKELKQRRYLTIITNSVEVLLEFAELKQINLISTGGILREHSLSLVGLNTIHMLSRYNADKAVISCKGLDLAKGLTDTNELEAGIKKTMMQSCKQTILTVDSSKFNQVAFCKVAEVSSVGIVVSDVIPEGKWLDFFAEKGISII